MKHIHKLSVVVSLCLMSHISNPTSCFAQCPGFVNGSFENGGTECFGCVPSSWTSCTFTPDVWAPPTSVLDPLLPQNGSNYIGIGSYDAGAAPNNNESFGQTLSSPLTIGGTYSFSIALYIKSTISFPPVLEIWGGSAGCGKSQLLWTSPPVTNTNAAGWVNYTVTFALPTSAWSNLTFAITCPSCNITFTDGSYLFMDDLCGIPLPITLLSFMANCTLASSPSTSSGHAVRVAWSTATETNNDYFTIERSSEPGVRSWEKIGTVKGAGNSTATLNYEFTDNSPSLREGRDGLFYYRLSQTDFDGKTETFNSQQVAVDVTECAVKVFPNPAGNTLHVPYVAEQDGEITLQVYDVIGKLVKQKVVAAVKGNNKFTLDLTTVAQGMYLLRVKGAAKYQNEKFVKQ